VSGLLRFRHTHTITVALAPGRAMPLFTARGERDWVPGWVPEFPAGEPDGADIEDEGTVFVTAAHGKTTYWVVAARSDRSVRYARVTPGRSCGTVDVRERESGAAHTALDVTYDLTALTAEGEQELHGFAARFAEEIGDWERAIATALARA
jgi:hypothetical protein